MQIKTAMKYHFIIEWFYQKGQEITNVGKDAEKKESLYTVGGNISWCSHSGIQYAEPSKKLKNRAII